MTRKQRKMLWRILSAAALLLVLQFLPVEGVGKLLLYLMPYAVVGWDILWRAAKGVWNRQVFDENFLMAVATVGALVIGVTRTGDYTEAVAVMLFYQIGELFQSYAVGKSRRSIAKLMDIRPDSANMETDAGLVATDPEQVHPGTVIVVQPGERVPLDGVVVSGSAMLDTAALTGESMPRQIGEGEEILSGCVNMDGVLRIRTTKPFEQSTVSRILELVENASSRKSRSEKFISRFALFYTPVVCCSALALAVFPPLWNLLILQQTAQWGQWIYRALTFLVISCPCALVISIPLTFFAGIGGAGNAGILVKGANYLEALAQIDTVVLDKTGTLTRGEFSVTEIRDNRLAEGLLLEYAALAESASSHPISQSLRRAYGAQIDRGRVKNVREYSGSGVTAEIDGKAVACGNEKLMRQLGVDFTPREESGTVVYVSVEGSYGGCICIADGLKENAAQAMIALKKLGIRNLVMLTGDNEQAARQAAQQLGITQVYSRLLPADKVEKVEQFLTKSKGKLAFVGDGINDAPVLSRADIGIAMGAMGSDAAIEAADVVLMDDDPMKLASAIRISKNCMAIVWQNIVFAMGVKLICLLLGALGIANMWLAIFADVGVMVLAVLNAIRTLYVKR